MLRSFSSAGVSHNQDVNRLAGELTINEATNGLDAVHMDTA
jgi:hypothetical protein